MVPSSSRLSIGAKSPLTGGIKESNAGGSVAKKMATLGIKAIILEGKPSDSAWNVLKITNTAVTISPAREIEGSGKLRNS